MRFHLAGPPQFQLHHGWKSILGIAGGIGAMFIPGVGPAIAPAIMKAGQAWDAAGAEKDAAKQEQGGYEKGAAILSPYNARGNAAGDTLAGYLGIDVPSGGFGGPDGQGPRLMANGEPMPTSLAEWYARPGRQLGERNPQPQTLGDYLTAADQDGMDEGLRKMMPPPNRGSGPRSSYGTLGGPMYDRGQEVARF